MVRKQTSIKDLLGIIKNELHPLSVEIADLPNGAELGVPLQKQSSKKNLKEIVNQNNNDENQDIKNVISENEDSDSEDSDDETRIKKN